LLIVVLGLWVYDGVREREREREQHGFTVNKSLGFGKGGRDSCCEVGWQLNWRVGSFLGSV
jgi:hypothetical protein